MVSRASANDLPGISLDPNVLIQESKTSACDVRPEGRPTGRAVLASAAGYQQRAASVMTITPVVTAGRRRGESPGDRSDDDAHLDRAVQHARQSDPGTSSSKAAKETRTPTVQGRHGPRRQSPPKGFDAAECSRGTPILDGPRYESRVPAPLGMPARWASTALPKENPC